MNLSIRGAVLSGGHSRRMGRAKGGLLLPGTGLTMETRALGLLAVATKSKPVISGPGGIPDIRFDHGPLGGMETLLWRLHAQAVLFIPCDMPYLSLNLLQELIREFEKCPLRPAVVARPSLEPLLAVIPSSFRQRITNAVAAGHLKVGRFLIDCGFSSVAVSDMGVLHDVDHPWELPA